MFAARSVVPAFLIASITVSACAQKTPDNAAPASQDGAAPVQTPKQPPSEAKKPEVSNLDTATPEERFRLYPYTAPNLNFRDVLSPLLKDAKALYSQYYEELVIRDFFQDEKNGVFLDVGCYHPIYISTTYYLEHHLGWSGYAIDAIAQHRKEWAKERPNSKFFAYAITDHDGDTIPFYVNGGMSSIDEKQADLFGGKAKPIQVPTITLNTLLDQQGVKKIDFVSMDIEGAEPGALKGFDIQRFKPRLVCIEQSPPEKNIFMLEYFRKNGYERLNKYLAVDKVNWYFTPKTAK